jgi:methyl-accepting chemotaxis protein
MSMAENTGSKKIKSLKVKVGIRLMIILSLIMGIFAGVSSFQLNKRLNAELNDLAKISSNRLARQLASPLWAIDQEVMNSILDAELLQKEVAGIVIKDPDDERMLLGKKRDQYGGTSELDNFLEGDYIKKTETILHTDNSPLGRLEVYITKQYSQEELRNTIILELLEILALDVIILITMVLLLNKMMINPIKHLTEVADNMSKGKLNTPLNIDSGDEIQQLADVLDRMRASLSYAFKKLKG